MGFIQDWIFYNSGNMAPPEHHLWAGLSVLAMTTGRKVYTVHGETKDDSYFEIYTDMYICLVGRQGIKKGTAKDNAQKLFTSTFPDYPIGPSVQSREDIVTRMSEEGPGVIKPAFKNEFGVLVEWAPMAFFLNELKNFMSINPQGMIEFLTDIYDRKFFDARTLKHGLQAIVNPCINILACETPAWLVQNMKKNVITGGFSRRLTMVYVTRRIPKITFPYKTPEMQEAYVRCQDHLKKVDALRGQFQWDSQETKNFFEKWHKSLFTPNDEILEGFYEAKDILTIKLAMLVSVSDYERYDKLLLTQQNLEEAIAILESIEPNLPKLTAAAGQNPLAIPTQRILHLLEINSGWMPMKLLKKEINKDVDPRAEFSVFRHLIETDQIVVQDFQHNGVRIEMVLTPKKHSEIKEGVKNG